MKKKSNSSFTVFLVIVLSILFLGISSNLVRGIGGDTDASSTLRDDENENDSMSASTSESESSSEEEDDPETPTDVPTTVEELMEAAYGSNKPANWSVSNPHEVASTVGESLRYKMLSDGVSRPYFEVKDACSVYKVSGKTFNEGDILSFYFVFTSKVGTYDLYTNAPSLWNDAVYTSMYLSDELYLYSCTVTFTEVFTEDLFISLDCGYTVGCLGVGIVYTPAATDPDDGSGDDTGDSGNTGGTETPEEPETPVEPEEPVTTEFSGESDILLSNVTTNGTTTIDANNGTVNVAKGVANAFEFVFSAPEAGVYAFQMSYAEPTEWSNTFLHVTSASAPYVTRLHYGGNGASDQVAGTDVAYRYLTAGENTIKVYAQSDSFSLSGITCDLVYAADHSIAGDELTYHMSLDRNGEVTQGFISSYGLYMLRYDFVNSNLDSVSFDFTPAKTGYYDLLVLGSGNIYNRVTSTAGHEYISDFFMDIGDHRSTCLGSFLMPTCFYMQAGTTYTFTFTGYGGTSSIGRWTNIGAFHFIETDAPELPDVSTDVPSSVTIPEAETAVAYINASDLPNASTWGTVYDGNALVEDVSATANISVPFTAAEAGRRYYVRFFVEYANDATDDASSLSSEYGTVSKLDVEWSEVYNNGYTVTYTFDSTTTGAVELIFTPGQKIDFGYVLITTEATAVAEVAVASFALRDVLGDNECEISEL